MAPTTFHRHYRRTQENHPTSSRGRPPVLTDEEEETVIQTLLKFSHHGYHMTRDDLAECVQLLCQHMPEERRKQMPFTELRPGIYFIRAFEKRHKSRIKVGKASRQGNKRFVATNAENLTTFYAELEAIIRDNAIDEKRICNLDESGVSPDRDHLGASKKLHYGTRSAPIQQRLVEFSYPHRITIMPVIFANGECRKPLFVFKGKQLPYRTINVYGKDQIETLHDCLPTGTLIRMKQERGGVDKEIFVEWVKLFVEGIRYLTANGRKVLLLYDA